MPIVPLTAGNVWPISEMGTLKIMEMNPILRKHYILPFFFLKGIRKIYVYFLSDVNEHGREKQPINNEMVITDG